VSSVRCIEDIEIATTCNSDIMFRELMLNGFYQDDVLVGLRHLLEPGDVFWDIGANYGFMSIYVDRVFDGAVKTVAFEPNPVVLGELRENLRRNQCRNVAIEEVCLSDRAGETSFYTSSDHSWNATLIRDFAEINAENIEVKVETSTIDECVERLPPPSVIKLDVEGAEYLVAKGGRGFLASKHPPIIVEYNTVAIEQAGLTPEEYLGFFRELGYEIYALKRPPFGFHRWSSLHRAERPSRLRNLCNLILLDALDPRGAGK
jgi:FkbM family methyltransferase